MGGDSDSLNFSHHQSTLCTFAVDERVSPFDGIRFASSSRCSWGAPVQAISNFFQVHVRLCSNASGFDEPQSRCRVSGSLFIPRDSLQAFMKGTMPLTNGNPCRISPFGLILVPHPRGKSTFSLTSLYCAQLQSDRPWLYRAFSWLLSMELISSLSRFSFSSKGNLSPSSMADSFDAYGRCVASRSPHTPADPTTATIENRSLRRPSM